MEECSKILLLLNKENKFKNKDYEIIQICKRKFCFRFLWEGFCFQLEFFWEECNYQSDREYIFVQINNKFIRDKGFVRNRSYNNNLIICSLLFIKMKIQ